MLGVIDPSQAQDDNHAFAEEYVPFQTVLVILSEAKDQ
jgi:hypothetical protein